MNDQLAFNLQSQIPLALPAGAVDDGDEGRQARGMAIAAITRIEKNPLGYTIPSLSGNGSYVMNNQNGGFCSCPDFAARQQPCKHLYALEFVIQRQERPDGTQTVRIVATGQNWPAYNAAQVNEQSHFVSLLRDLCNTIPQPEQRGRGRPRLPLGDMVFAVAAKVYSGMSGRRAMGDIQHAHADGLVDRVPCFSSVARYLENPGLTPTLKRLIEQSALPLKAVDTGFAVDSTGFATNVFDRWYSHKWGKQIKEARWIKSHVITGVKTNVVTSAEVEATMSHDTIHFAPLVLATAENFTINEVSADKAYLSKRNLHVVDDLGGVAYIPFKANSKAITHHKRDRLWERAFHYFNLHSAEFMERYHLRSNVETTFSVIKAKFGGFVRSKTPAAQVNEVYAKILCHNIVVLIHAMYELGVDPIFDGNISTDTPSVEIKAWG